jgi:hypothetical protein
MATLHAIATPRKAFYAHLYDEPGLLFQHVDGRIMFLNEANDRITTIEAPDINFLTVLGECTIATEQKLRDLTAGGAARIACTREQGVR